MLWSDLIFVFAFLPIYLICGLLCRETWAKNLVCVAASLIFIAWGRQWYYALIVLPVFPVYICGLLSKRINNRVAEAICDVIAVLTSAVFVIDLSREPSLSSAIWSIAFISFALRCVLYTRYISEGMEPERDPIALIVYFISLEGFLLPPTADYPAVRKELSSRRQSLKKMSAGLSEFIKGFALTSVCAMSLERVRLAATEYEAFPWLNALTLIIVTAAEAYMIAAGFSRMSCGLRLMAGYSAKAGIPAFAPHFKLSRHVSEIVPGSAEFIKKSFCGRSGAGVAASLAAVSLLSGIFIGFGSGAGAFAGIIILAMMIEGGEDTKPRASDAVISAILGAAAVLALLITAPGGMTGLFSAFDISAYDYDITYILNKVLLRSWPWFIVGTIALSGIPRVIFAAVRRKMSQSERAYGGLRIAETVYCALLLILGTIAAAA